MLRRAGLTLVTVLVGLAAVASPATASTPPQKAIPLVAGYPSGQPVVTGAFPVYPVTATGDTGGTTDIGWRQVGIDLVEFNQNGATRWGVTDEYYNDFPQLSGGFDFQGDGWPDVMSLAEVAPTQPYTYCPSPQILRVREPRIFSGTQGTRYQPSAIPDLYDKCSNGTVRLARWSPMTPLFGEATPNLGTDLVINPYHWNQGWFADFAGGNFTTRLFASPYTFGFWWSFYNHAVQPYPGLEQSPTLNGLVMQSSGENRLVAFANGGSDGTNQPTCCWGPRIVEYSVDDEFVHEQLDVDLPLPDNCTPVGETYTGCNTIFGYLGRTYGLVVKDPNSNKVILLAGIDGRSMFAPMNTGNVFAGSDPAETRMVIYDIGTKSAEERFYAAHQPWKNRLLYPANPLVKLPSGPSRIAYNLWSNAPHYWRLHITEPGSTSDDVVLQDVFLWDIRDVDNDGVDEWITSPDSHRELSGYLPDKTTVISTWDEQTQTLVPEQTINGYYPYLTPTFRRSDATTTEQYLYPVMSYPIGSTWKLWVTQGGSQFPTPVLKP